MKIGKTLYVKDRKAWRVWLRKHFAKESEIWLIYPKKSSGKPRISYNDAVEEALCFGWIDSIVKSIDDQRSAQRFSPRRAGSNWSQLNRERVRVLARSGKLHSSVRASVQKILKEKFVFPPDIVKAVKRNKEAWRNYQKFSPTYRRIRVAYIDGARDRPEEFKKRLGIFIKKTEQNKRIGFGGIEKYF